MPITRPWMPTSAPPELPWLIAALAWLTDVNEKSSGQDNVCIRTFTSDVETDCPTFPMAACSEKAGGSGVGGGVVFDGVGHVRSGPPAMTAPASIGARIGSRMCLRGWSFG